MSVSFSEYKSLMSVHNASSTTITSNKSVDDIYWCLLYSDEAMKRKVPNMPSNSKCETNLKVTAKIFMMLVKAFGKPLKINSGYRSVELNTAIRGSKTSQHMSGQAIDIDTSAGNASTNWELFLFIINHPLFKNKFYQIIWELYGNWVHCSFVVKDPNADITLDSSYNAAKRITLSPEGKTYSTMTPIKDDNGYLCFNVKGLTGKRYNGGNNTNAANGANEGEFSDNNTYASVGDVSGGNSYGSGGSSYSSTGGRPIMPSRGSNTIYQLAAGSEKQNVMKQSDDRKAQFENMLNEMSNSAPELGRSIIKCSEMYDSSILKTGQYSKKERV